MNEVKLFILGEVGAGKTTLANLLCDRKKQAVENESHVPGVEIGYFDLKSLKENDFRINVWDFSEQAIYYGTHQLFLSPNSIYILVLDTRKEDVNIYYWLQLIDTLASDSPVIILQNEKEDRVKLMDFETIQHRFEFVRDIVRTNLLTQRILGLNLVIELVKQELDNLTIENYVPPATWFDIRLDLELLKRKNDIIPLTQYLEICTQYGIHNKGIGLDLLQHLSKSGGLLHIKDNAKLDNLVILNIGWVNDAIFSLFNSELINHKQGIFKQNDFNIIWKEGKHYNHSNEILEVLQTFEFCYKLGETNIWVIPQLLPVTHPSNFSWNFSNNLKVVYKYDLLPTMLIHRLYAALYNLLLPTKSTVLRNEFVFSIENAQAYVSLGYDTKLVIRISGLRANYLLARINIVVKRLNQMYARINCETLIPCNCFECFNSTDPHLYIAKSLNQTLKKGVKYITCEKSFQGVNIEGLIERISGSIDIAYQDSSAQLKYVIETEKQGKVPLNEGKIVVVGPGGSGKTTLIQKMKDPAHPVPNTSDQRTQGIKVSPIHLDKKLNNKKIKAYIWDFGGQELYYATHQFFLSPETFYILLNDNRKNDTDFYYWLNIISVRAGDDCPIFCVFNEKENAKRQISLQDPQFSFFPKLIDECLDLDFADSQTSVFKEMRDKIESNFLQIPILSKTFPANWVKVRNALEKVTDPYITWKQFRSICVKQKIPKTDEEQIKIIAQTLHNLGNILWFPNVFGMEHLVILNPQWCLDATYKVLDCEEVEKSGGRFNLAHLRDMWSEDSYSEQKASLEQLLRHFDLCYETQPNSGKFIAPQLLPLEARPWADFPKAGCIIFKYKYEFMPAGLISRFIARVAQYIVSDHVWRRGVVMDWGNDTIGEAIENPSKREITLKVCGTDRKRRMNEMRETLDTIHSLYKGLSYEQLISCNCEDCNSSNTPTIHNLEYLEEHAEDDKEVLCKVGKRKWIAANKILEGFEYADIPRIFISYSHKNENYKNDFREMIRPLERNRNWKVWDDHYILPSEEWNTKIFQHLNEANIIVLLLTPSFFNSDYINNIELTRAIERHESGSALLIGIVVCDCMWEETPLNRIQMLPKEGKPIDQHENANEVWKTVADTIKHAVSRRDEIKKITS